MLYFYFHTILKKTELYFIFNLVESGHFSAIARIENPSKIYRSLSNVNVHDDFEVEFSLDLKFIKLDSE